MASSVPEFPSTLLKLDPPAKVTQKGNFSAGVMTTTSRKSSSTGAGRGAEDVLERAFPPRTWSKDGEVWVQRVSATPATTLDLVQLQDKLDAELRRRGAQDAGICPVREDLYASFFDELIRQVTVHCGERGQVLVRIRDELQATVGAYQTLYESGVAFGMRKALTSDRDKAELSAHAAVLEAEVGDLEATVAALEARAAELAAQEEGPGSAAAAVEAAHQAEAGALRAAIAATKEALETALAPPPMAAAVPK